MSASFATTFSSTNSFDSYSVRLSKPQSCFFNQSFHFKVNVYLFDNHKFCVRHKNIEQTSSPCTFVTIKIVINRFLNAATQNQHPLTGKVSHSITESQGRPIQLYNRLSENIYLLVCLALFGQDGFCVYGRHFVCRQARFVRSFLL